MFTIGLFGSKALASRTSLKLREMQDYMSLKRGEIYSLVLQVVIRGTSFCVK
jgi:hypothetical protein